MNPACKRMSWLLTRYVAAAVVLGSFGPALAADDSCGKAVRPYAAALADRVVIGAEALAKRIEAGDLEGAKRAWIEARVGWERGEPFLIQYFPQALLAIDDWPNADTGFHAIERILFVDGDVAAAQDLARKLVADAVALRWELEETDLDADGLISGLVAAATELGRAKSGGGESPLAGTSADDVRDQLQGIEMLYALSFASMTRARHPVLHARIMANLIALGSALRAPTISEFEGARVLLLSEHLRDDFQEIAVLVELEGIEIRE
jgi:iron uptake system EfeUOB component EfeO/EfeM